jgi:hypothetical protein
MGNYAMCPPGSDGERKGEELENIRGLRRFFDLVISAHPQDSCCRDTAEGRRHG